MIHTVLQSAVLAACACPYGGLKLPGMCYDNDSTPLTTFYIIAWLMYASGSISVAAVPKAVALLTCCTPRSCSTTNLQADLLGIIVWLYNDLLSC